MLSEFFISIMQNTRDFNNEVLIFPHRFLNSSGETEPSLSIFFEPTAFSNLSFLPSALNQHQPVFAHDDVTIDEHMTSFIVSGDRERRLCVRGAQWHLLLSGLPVPVQLAASHAGPLSLCMVRRHTKAVMTSSNEHL